MSSVIIVLLILLVTLTPSIPRVTIIELIPDVVEKYSGPEIKVYLNYEGSNCAHGTGDRIFAGVRKAFDIHRAVMLRFVGEFGWEYSDLLNLRFVEVTSKEYADLIIEAIEITDGTGGFFAFGDRPPFYVGFDCDIAFLYAGMYTVILHELYHALGLGHIVGPENKAELMGGALIDSEEPAYPSTLNVMALWELWFNNYREDIYRLRPDVLYAVVTPYNVEIEKLKSAITTLEFFRQENLGLKLTLQYDIKRLNDTLAGLVGDVSGLRGEVLSLNSALQSLEKTVSSHDSSLAEILSRERRLREELERERSRISSLESSLAATTSRLDEALKRLEERQNLYMLSLILIGLASGAALTLAARGRKLRAS